MRGIGEGIRRKQNGCCKSFDALLQRVFLFRLVTYRHCKADRLLAKDFQEDRKHSVLLQKGLMAC